MLVSHRYDLCEFNDDHSVEDWWDSGSALSLDSAAYLEYEADLAFKVRHRYKHYRSALPRS